DPLTHEPSVGPERHRLTDRDLFDQGGNPQRPVEPAQRNLVNFRHGRHDTRHTFSIRMGAIPPGAFAYTRTRASSSTAEQRTLNPQVSGSNPEGRTPWPRPRSGVQVCKSLVVS